MRFREHLLLTVLAELFCQDLACKTKTNVDIDFIRSPNHPGNYPNNVICYWSIEFSKGLFAKLSSTKFDIEYAHQCVTDSLTFLGRTLNESSRLCGTKVFEIEIYTSPLTLLFVSDSSEQSSGFEIRVAMERNFTVHTGRKHSANITECCDSKDAHITDALPVGSATETANFHGETTTVTRTELPPVTTDTTKYVTNKTTLDDSLMTAFTKSPNALASDDVTTTGMGIGIAIGSCGMLVAVSIAFLIAYVIRNKHKKATQRNKMTPNAQRPIQEPEGYYSNIPEYLALSHI